jgi:phage shock protein PspC (stress-responsive transcriptional regulator)
MAIARRPFVCSARWIGGVCSGIAFEQGWPIWPVRLLFIVLTLDSFGFGALLYGLLWIVLPAEW